MRSECDPPRAALRNDAEIGAATNVVIDLITEARLVVLVIKIGHRREVYRGER